MHAILVKIMSPIVPHEMAGKKVPGPYCGGLGRAGGPRPRKLSRELTPGRWLVPCGAMKPLPAALVLLLVPSLAGAEGLAGLGRVRLQPGWRLTPNDTFFASATAAGAPPVAPSPGGPALFGSFAYSASELIEVGVDLFAGGEFLRLTGREPLLSLTYGGLIGARLHQALGDLGPFREVVAHVGLLAGPTLIYVRGGGLAAPTERLTTGYLASAGIFARIGERWGLCADYRLLLARGMVPGIGGVNGGGSWLGLGVVWYFPPEVSLVP